MIHTKAYAQNEWRGASPWSEPTSAILPAGGSRTYGVRMRLAADVEQVTAALLHAGLPVAVPLPGPTLHMDMADARLQLHLPWSGGRGSGGNRSGSGAGHALDLADAAAEPAGCVAFREAPPLAPSGELAPRLRTLRLLPKLAGRCRLRLRYTSSGGGDAGGGAAAAARPPDTVQLVHLMLLEPATTLVRRHGAFCASTAFLPSNASDPWGRAPAFMGSDADADAPLLEEARVFMGGLSDESGAAASLAMAAKQLGMPHAAEIAKLEAYVHETLWQGAQPERKRFLQGADYSVKQREARLVLARAPPRARANARTLSCASLMGTACARRVHGTCACTQVRLSMLYWSDGIEAAPSAVQAAAPSLYRTCHKCWATCKKKRDCCYWMQ